MITKTTARKMTDDQLTYVAQDLREAIAAQEPTAREWGMEAVPKLGQYYDELAVVAAEINRRKSIPPAATVTLEAFEAVKAANAVAIHDLAVALNTERAAHAGTREHLEAALRRISHLERSLEQSQAQGRADLDAIAKLLRERKADHDADTDALAVMVADGTFEEINRGEGGSIEAHNIDVTDNVVTLYWAGHTFEVTVRKAAR